MEDIAFKKIFSITVKFVPLLTIIKHCKVKFTAALSYKKYLRIRKRNFAALTPEIINENHF